MQSHHLPYKCVTPPPRPPCAIHHGQGSEGEGSIHGKGKGGKGTVCTYCRCRGRHGQVGLRDHAEAGAGMAD